MSRMTLRRPLNIIMDLTSRCNLKCRMCYFAELDQVRFEPFNVLPSPDGAMPVELFETIAADLFPRAWRVALGCAAEPLIHPELGRMLEIAGAHGVPDLWFPTNLLTLTEAKAQAVVKAGVRTVGVSVDGVRAETYESIRTGSSWDRLMSRLELLARVKRELGSRTPRLRVIFVWMQSNRAELRELPAFAHGLGACELDVRYVTPTKEVDVSDELLTGEDPAGLRSELAAVAGEAVRLGLRLVSFPEFERRGEVKRSLAGKVRHRLWLVRAGLDRPEYWRHALRQTAYGCAYPGATFVIRPNGAVLPCPFWQEDPIGLYPRDSFKTIMASRVMEKIRGGERDHVHSCRSCVERRRVFYRPWDTV